MTDGFKVNSTVLFRVVVVVIVVHGDGVRLCLRTVATNKQTVHPPDDT
jgi:hypothetical protein